MGCASFQKIREEAATYFQVASAEDPIFRAIASSIKKDQALFSESASLDSAELDFENLCEASFLLRKGSKVLMSRWASWLQSARDWLPQWHTRCLIPL
eukprot:8087212-Alexandrium_andersonii.AAC.1